MSTPICTVAGSTYSSAGSDAENGRPVISTTSSARTMRRPLSRSIRAAASGSTAAQPCVQLPACRPTASSASSRGPDAPRRCPGTRSGRAPPACRAPSRPTSTGTRPRPRTSAIAARAQPWNCATVAGSRTDEGVEQVVRDPRALGRRRLGGADVHAAVERHRVGVDHLAAEPLGQVEREPGLARGGRPRRRRRSAGRALVGPCR